jgi:hypothetical protein
MENFNMINHFEHLFQSLEMRIKISINIMHFLLFFFR